MNRGIDYIVLVSVILTIHPFIFAQNNINSHKIDSLINFVENIQKSYSDQILSDHSDSIILSIESLNNIDEQFNAFDKIGFTCEKSGGFVVALELYHRGLTLAKRHSDSNQEIQFSNFIGLVHFNQSNHDIAAYYFNDSYEMAFNMHDTIAQLKSLINLGAAYRHLCDYDLAIINLQKAIDLSIAKNDCLQLAKAYHNIASIYLEIEDFSQSIKFYQQSIDAYSQLRDTLGVASIQNNLGITNHRAGDYEEAINALLKGLRLLNSYQKHDYFWSREVARTLGNLSMVYEGVGNEEEALKYCLFGVALGDSLNDSLGSAAAYLTLGRYQLNNREYQEALESFSVAYDISSELRELSIHQESARHLGEVYNLLGDYYNTSKYLLLSQQLQDSIRLNEQVSEIARIQIQYLTRQKEEEIKLLQKELKVQQLESTQRRMIYILGGSIIILILSLALGMVLIRRRTELRKARQQQEVFEAQAIIRKEIAEDLHEDVVNMLALTEAGLKGLGSVLKELNGKFKPKYDRLVSMIRKATMRVRDYSHTLNSEVLWEQGLEIALLEVLDRLDSNTPMDVDFDFVNIEEELPYKTRLSIYRIVMECVNNVLRHAKATELYVKLIREGMTLSILVKDNGVGFEEGSKGIGIGLDNIHKRIGMLEGEYKIDSEPGKGTTVNITMDVYREN